MEETEALAASVLHETYVKKANNWPQTHIGAVAEVIDPNPSHRMPQYAERGIPFVSTVDFDGLESIRKATAKYVTEATYKEQVKRCNFEVNDILYSRIGTIGEARILTEVWPFALSHVLVVIKPRPEVVIPRFLLWYLRSDAIAVQATNATQSIGVPDLGIKRIRNFRLPLPTLSEQRRIVTYLDDLEAKAISLRRMQAETAAELAALLPSVLDRALK